MRHAGAADGAPPAKRRKKSKNKFKPASLEAPLASSAVQATDGGAAKTKGNNKKRRGKFRHAAGEVDETVGAQADAPEGRPQQAAPAAVGSTGGSGPSAFAPPGQPTMASLASRGKKGKGGGSLLEQMRARLQGGRFRWLNEALYTSDGAAALSLVQREPEVMQQYHEGFREQTKGWPVQPVDQAIAWLRRHPSEWEVADLGCGDAKIAASLAPRGQRVHSFDLASTAPGVVACNMAYVPLPAGSVDVAVFCLSLMGTDYGSFLEEAARILRPAGWLWIAEVQSRFVDGAGRSVLPAFEGALRALGFAVRGRDTSNSHFLVLEAQREQQAKQGQGGGKKGGSKRGEQGGGSGSTGGRQGRQLAWPELRACQYKKR